MHKKTVFFTLVLILVVLGFAVGKNKFSATSTSPAPSRQVTDVTLKNGDTYTMTAEPITKDIGGKKYKMMGYNGIVPGPVIHVTQGDTVTIHFVNKTKYPTLLHSHGVRADNKYDGTHLTQADIKPGESFDYVLTFPDAGVFWYHPHVREDQQQNAGLFGNFVVSPKDKAYWPPADHEETLMLSDVLIEEGQLAPYSDSYITHALMGRFGNTLLVNGKTKETLHGEPGEVHRFYVTNAATTRPFNWRIAGAKMKLVGGDNGRVEKEVFVDGVILAPGDRSVVDVYFPTAGTYAIENKTPDKTYTLGEVIIAGAPYDGAGKTFETLRTDQDLVNQFTLFRKNDVTRTPDKYLTLLMEADMGKIMGYMGGMGNMGGGHMHNADGTEMGNMMGTSSAGGMGMMMGGAVPKIEWEDTMGAMNVYSTSKTVKWIIRDDATGKQNADIVWTLPKDNVVKVRITNDLKVMHPMQHPIHFHGNRFAVLSTNGVPTENMSWEDTVLLGAGDTIDILLETSEAGKWVTHCHIAEHMHSGMMMEYDVE